MQNPNPPIAGYLRERRESAGMTRAALSAAAGISPGLIQKIEQGTRAPTLEALTALFDALTVPEVMRDHLISLAISSRYDPGAGPLVRPADRVLLDGITHPASLQMHPTFDVVATNAAWRSLFPGLDTGMSMLEWMLLDPRARIALIDWEQQVHMCVYGFRIMGPGLATEQRIDEIVDTCARAPEWAKFWTTDPAAPTTIDDPVMHFRDPRTGATTAMTVHSLGAALIPRRAWSLVVYAPAQV
ncbi:helix-turn-helix domain-containing protein [Nocardia rhizosphaerae]|uniref:Helix-turn-helix domain-containing protein n=1 Tax=Nocardia rhizosphaerae TaxID=1691571 RepID=A0ABV8L596_9NOCA